MKTKIALLTSISTMLAVIGCQAAPPYISPSANYTQLAWTINDANATATNIKWYDGTNWDTEITIGAPTNTCALAGLPLGVLCATSVEPGGIESNGSNQITNSPNAVAPGAVTKK